MLNLFEKCTNLFLKTETLTSLGVRQDIIMIRIHLNFKCNSIFIQQFNVVNFIPFYQQFSLPNSQR